MECAPLTVAEKTEDPVEKLFALADETKYKMVDLFRALDTNGASAHSFMGVSTPLERRIADTLGVTFRAGDGTVELSELRGLLAKLGVTASRPATKDFFAVLDIDGDGSCSIAEFYERIRQVKKQRRVASQTERRMLAIEARNVQSPRSVERMQVRMSQNSATVLLLMPLQRCITR